MSNLTHSQLQAHQRRSTVLRGARWQGHSTRHVAVCRVAEVSPSTPIGTARSTEDDVSRRQLASHLSFEGDFNPSVVWPTYPHEPYTPSPDPAPAEASTSNSSASAATASATAHAEDQHPLVAEAAVLEALIDQLQSAASLTDKVVKLMSHPRVNAFVLDSRNHAVMGAIYSMAVEEQFVLLCLPAMGQSHVLTLPHLGTPTYGHLASTDALGLQRALTTLAAQLLRVEQFYDSIGGLLGYQRRSLALIVQGSAEACKEQQAAAATQQPQPAEQTQQQQQEPAAAAATVQYHVPRALDLAGEEGREVGQRTAAAGLAALPRMAEIYPVGGAGDRLGLQCEVTGECLPSAMLPYCGRTMLEGLMRDLQAREYLYYKITGTQVTTPVAIMSSEAKGNHQRIMALMERLNWFGRGTDSFHIFKQPLVPVISVADGRWLLSAPLKPMSKPGGHGAIWKLMKDEGIFSWLQSKGRQAALVRQISNPMAGVDTTLLALAGCGAKRGSSAFGFMSCDRTIGASEGCNVLQERQVVNKDGRVQYEYGYTNIEYTEFERLGISDQPVDGNSRRSVFPANTNVLYVGLQQAEAVVNKAITTSSPEQLMPGLIFNLKKKVAYTDPLTGQEQKLHAGRMECTMQNIADFMTDSYDAPMSPAEAARAELSTFLVYNMRRKVTSSAKKKREPGSTRISQTPDGSFYDLQRNAWHLLQQCNLKQLPELGSVEQYLEQGPGFIFLFNPALGPLWDVISQKIVGGSLHQGSELVLEVAEARLRDVHVAGSLLVYADNVVGHTEDTKGPGAAPQLRFSSHCGRINMTNVVVSNQGVDWEAQGNVYWKHQVARHQAARILLHGNAEFEAHDVTLVGDVTFEVPSGYRMLVTPGAGGSSVPQVRLLPLSAGGQQPTWSWQYRMAAETGQVTLHYQCSSSSHAAMPVPAFAHAAHYAPAPTTQDMLLPMRQAPRERQQPVLAANNVQPLQPQHWKLLNQLSQIDTALDFSI